MCLSVCVCVRLPACPPVCPFPWLAACLSVSTYLSTCLPARPSVHPSISLTACISVSVCLPAVSPPACSSICPSVCPFVYFHGCLPVSVYVCLCIYICLSMSDNGSIFLGVLQVSVIYKVAFAWAQYAFSAFLLFFMVDENTICFQMTLNDLISKR